MNKISLRTNTRKSEYLSFRSVKLARTVIYIDTSLKYFICQMSRAVFILLRSRSPKKEISILSSDFNSHMVKFRHRKRIPVEYWPMLVNHFSVNQISTTHIDLIHQDLSKTSCRIAPSKDDYVAQHLTECKMVCTNIQSCSQSMLITWPFILKPISSLFHYHLHGTDQIDLTFNG